MDHSNGIADQVPCNNAIHCFVDNAIRETFFIYFTHLKIIPNVTVL